MKSSSLITSHRLQVPLTFVVCCALLLGLFITAESVQGQNRRRRQQTRTAATIIFDKVSLQIKPRETLTIRATILDKQGLPLPNAKVDWSVPPSTEGLLSREVVGNVLLVTRTEVPAATGQTSIPIIAQSGTAQPNIVYVQLDGSVTPQGIKVARGSKIVLDQVPATVSPGTVATITASVKGKDGNDIEDAKVEWEIQPKALEEFARLVSPVNKGGVNSVTVVGLFGNPKSTKPKIIPIVASSGEASPGVLLVNYGAASTLQSSNEIRIDTGASDLVLAPGHTISLDVTVVDEKGSPLKEQPPVTWEIPPAVEEFVTLEVPDPKKNQVELTGRFGKGGTAIPSVIPVSVRAGDSSNIIMVEFQADLDQVKIYWDIIPPNICGDNFGRTIKNDYYCIDVAIVNNSPNDIRVTGITFNVKGTRTVTTSSYGLAKGSLEIRKLLYPRTLVLAGLSALGQLLTGFNPFFHNINHAKNYSQGIDIISNPLAKGLELAWPDAVPGEINRFEQQVLRDDQIISKNMTLRTKVFYPKDALFSRKDEGRKDLGVVREKLGEALIEGYQIRRAGPIK